MEDIFKEKEAKIKFKEDFALCDFDRGTFKEEHSGMCSCNLTSLSSLRITMRRNPVPFSIVTK